MTLGNLLCRLPVEAKGSWCDLEVQGLCMDSRKLVPGDLFCALPGSEADGRDYIHAAIDKGAAAVLAEGSLRHDWPYTQPQLAMPNLAASLGQIADRFWGHPSSSLKVVAVTGTNGKTSTALYLAQALGRLEEPSGVVGTLGAGLVGEVMAEPAAGCLTTPAATDLQASLRRLCTEGAGAAVLEASSHGLEQGRLAGTRIDIAVLTNITRDHLDYHGDFAAYKAAKQKLFSDFPLQGAVLNADDPAWEAFRDQLPKGVRYLTFSLAGKNADLRCEKLRCLADGLSLRFSLPTGAISLRVPLYGEFAAANLMASAAVLHLLGYSNWSIQEGLASVSVVPGRMERIAGALGPKVFIDYAHTPDALSRALASLRKHAGGRLWCVFGCGGDRDRSKRPIMGRLAAQLADHLVLTDDNPRGEDGAKIICDIQEGIKGPAAVQVERDRLSAISLALTQAARDDLVLIAGKGHETCQEAAGKRRFFSDHSAVAECLGVPA